MKQTVRIAVCLALAVCAIPALGASIAEEHAAAQALVKEGKLGDAAPHLRAVVDLANKAGWDKLPASQLLLVAEAHKLLMALAYEAALKDPEPEPEAARQAKHWRDLALGMQPVRTVARGQEIDLPELLVPGKTNIVDFFSIYCSPCVQFGVFIEALAEAREDVVLISVDINRPGHKGIDWASPTAKQFGLTSIPRLNLYGPDGKLLLEGDEARDKVIEMIEQAGLF